MKLLDRIDNYFYEKGSKKELVYSIVLIVFVLGFLMFYYVLPIAKTFEEKAKSTYENVLSSLQREKVELNVLKAKKIQSQKKLQMISKQLNELKKEKIFFDELTNLMDFAQFNQARWAEFVKNIIIDAKNEGLRVKLVKNITINEDKNKKTSLKKLPKSIIVKKMSIGLKLNGNYINFIHFIYKYEDRKDLIRVEKMKVNGRNDYYVEFSLYGYEK